MQHDALDNAMAMEGVSQAGHQSAENAVQPFREVDTAPRMPHASHAGETSAIEPDEFPNTDTVLQLRPTREMNETFDHVQNQHVSSNRTRISLWDGKPQQKS